MRNPVLIKGEINMAISINGIKIAGVAAPGKDGVNATINGVSALTLIATGGIAGTQSGEIYTLDGSGLVPMTRTVNGKPLSEDIALNAADVGADAAGAAQTALDNAKTYADEAIAAAITGAIGGSY